MALRWGIAAAGLISNDFTVALSTLPSSDHQVIAVASRDIKRSTQFSELHNISKAYGSYIELAKDPEIDVVYVGVIHPLHYDVCILMLDNGKHVLCEKPLCMNEKQAKKLIDHAKKKNLFLMEAIWSRFLPSYQYLKEQILKDALGDICEVNVTFGIDLSNVPRLNKKSLGGGVTLDLGIYTIQLSQWVFREIPCNITAKGKLNAECVDTDFEVELKYPNGGITKMKVSSLEQFENKAVITGTKGQIILNLFWACSSLIDVDGKEKKWDVIVPKGKTNFMNSTGLRYEAEEVRKCILKKKLESEDASHRESLTIANIEDCIRQQLGVRYDEDDK